MTKTPKKFNELLTHEGLLKNVREILQFESSTPIQEAVIPTILKGKDICGGAKTGSGKTIAFLLPIMERLLKNENKMAIVLSPTRELVLQIDEEAEKLLRGLEVTCVPAYGGVPVDSQVIAIKHHSPRLIIGTPGRVIDLFDEHILKPGDFEIAVLDEADRMCDMGFSPQINRILGDLRNLKQMLLFSATLPKELNEIMTRYTNDPVKIQVDAADEVSDTIEHHALYCRKRDKYHKLFDILQEPNSTSVVFCRTRRGADQLYNQLSRELDNIAILHAGFPMNERERTIRAFRDNKIRCLIATDVVARGIDVEHITHVIHYDLPETYEDYIHRSGRSGRAGKSGTTIALIEIENRDQKQLIQQISKKVSFKEMPGSLSPDDKGRHERRPHRGGGQKGRPHRGARDHTRGGARDRTSSGARDRTDRTSSGARDRTSSGARDHRAHARPHRHKSKKTQSKKGPQKASPTKRKSLLSKTKGFLKRAFKKSS